MNNRFANYVPLSRLLGLDYLMQKTWKIQQLQGFRMLETLKKHLELIPIKHRVSNQLYLLQLYLLKMITPKMMILSNTRASWSLHLTRKAKVLKKTWKLSCMGNPLNALKLHQGRKSFRKRCHRPIPPVVYLLPYLATIFYPLLPIFQRQD